MIVRNLKYIVIVLLMILVTVMAIIFPKYYFKILDNENSKVVIVKRNVKKSKLSFRDKLSIIADYSNGNSEEVNIYTFMEDSNEEVYNEIINYLKEEFDKIDSSLGKSINSIFSVDYDRVYDFEISKNLISSSENEFFMLRGIRLSIDDSLDLNILIDYDTNKIILLNVYIFNDYGFDIDDEKKILENYIKYLDVDASLVSFYFDYGGSLLLGLDVGYEDENEQIYLK